MTNTVAYENAQKIGAAVEKKFPKHKAYVRLIESGVNYIEIALRPENGTHTDEVVVAYSCEFFADPEVALQLKGQTVLKQLRIMSGLPA